MPREDETKAAFGIYPKQRAKASSPETVKRADDLVKLLGDIVLPKDAVDVGLMALPVAGTMRKLGAALIAGGATTDAEAGGLSALMRLLSKEAPAQARQIREALGRAYTSNVEHSVVGSADKGPVGSIVSGTYDSVFPNQLDIARALKSNGSIADFHTHPTIGQTAFDISPSSSDFRFASNEYFPGKQDRELRTIIASPADPGSRSPSAYSFFATDDPSKVFDRRKLDAAVFELQRGGSKGTFKSVLDDPRFREYFDYGGSMGELAENIAPLSLLDLRKAQGMGRGEVVLSGRPLSQNPESTNTELFKMMNPSAVEFLTRKGFAEGGAVHMDEGGAAFGVFPQLKARRAKQDREAAANAPLSALRGWAAGTAGLPGDIEGLARAGISQLPPQVLAAFPALRAFGIGSRANPTPQLPTTEFYNEYLPGAQLNATPTGQAFTTAGNMLGGTGATALAGLGVKGAKATGQALGPTAARMAENYLQRQGLMPGVIKPPGGNWAPAIGSKDSVEASIQPLKGGETDPANKWLDTKLQKYIRNEMGTPDDPIRLAHEEGYSHIPGDLAEDFGSWLPEDTASMRRQAGYPEHGFAVQKHIDAGYPEAMEANTRKAELWENLADTEITASPAGAYQEQFRTARDMPSFTGNAKHALQMAERNPWIEKLDRNTPIYKIDNPVELNTNLGFGHLSDELRNMLDPASGLPDNLRLTPEQLDKVTVKQMVKRVSKVNDWRAEEAAKAEMGDMMGNLTATPRLQIPDTQLSFVKEPGMTWIDIPATVDESAMKLCTTIGRQAGWCTQGEGLAKSYGSGDRRLTTLLDAEGRPHAQAMLTENKMPVSGENYARLDGATKAQYREHVMQWRRRNPDVEELTDADVMQALKEAGVKAPAPDIRELKPVGNEFSSARAREYAKRDPQYEAKITDSVLKFLNAGEWGKVNDLDHYNIVDLNNPNIVKRALNDVLDYDLPHERMDKFTAATHFNPDAPRFMSRNQFLEFVEPPPAPAPVKEQKMLQGFYRGYAGDYDANKAGADAGMVFVSPQRGVGDIFANKRAAQTGTDPHLEMILADPFAGYGYGMNVPLNKQNQKIDFTRARQLDPKDIKSRTQLYAEGGMVGTPVTTYDPIKIQQIIASLDDEYDPERIQQIVAQRESAYA